jgi:hypothetical protein
MFPRAGLYEPMQAKVAGTMQKIVAFHLDETLDWVADLQCGHQQLVRHNPPWTHRHWVTTPQVRLAHLVQELTCLAFHPRIKSFCALRVAEGRCWSSGVPRRRPKKRNAGEESPAFRATPIAIA